MSAESEIEEGGEVAEAVGRTFSLRAVLALLATTAGVSGFGGAATVAAQDAVQDERLEQHERQITELRAQVREGTEAATETRTTVHGLEATVGEIKTDTKEIQRLLYKLIGGRRSGASVEGDE